MTQSAFTIRLRAFLLILFLAAGALAWGACGDGGDGGNATPTSTPAEDGGNRPLTPTPLSEYSALELRLEAPSSARLGEHVPLKLTVENTAEGPVQFGLGSSEENNFPGAYDLVVTTDGGYEVWHWLGTLDAVDGVLSRVTLEPGEQLRFEQVWPQSDNKGGAVDPETYLVHGVFFPSNVDGDNRVELETEPTELVISP